MQLSEEQRIAAEWDGGDLLLLAGAGSGKTRTLIGRAAYLMRCGVPPERILCLTFTRRAANELKERLRGELGGVANEVVAGTFHFFALMVMRHMPKAFGMHEDITVIDRDDQQGLMRLARGGHLEKDEEFVTPKGLVDFYSYARNTTRPPDEYLEKFTELSPEERTKATAIFCDYEKRKTKGNYLDFDDILHRFAAALKDNERIREQIKGLFDHVLVDEMQDTNPLQWQILDALRGPARLFCVGDDAQAIYAFRGADFRNVHSFRERVPGSTVLKLVENYRSTQPILDLSNWLLDQSPLVYDKHLRAMRGPGELPRLLDFDSEYDEARWICDDMSRRYERTGHWRDHMILARSAYASKAMEALLIERRIPYVFIGGQSLLEAAHVKDLLSLLRASLNHFDELSWSRYLPLWKGVGERKATRAIGEVLGCAEHEAAQAALKAAFPALPQIAEGVAEVRALAARPVAAIARAAEFLDAILSTRYERWEQRKRDFELLGRLAQDHESLRAFIEAYTLDPVHTSAVDRLQNEDVVVLITVHSAKGTEAPVCYVIRAEPGTYPHTRSLGTLEAEEEERRVLYVAWTRAMDELYITRSASYERAGYDHIRSRTASRPENAYLLADIPEAMVRHQQFAFVSFASPGRGFGRLQDF